MNYLIHVISSWTSVCIKIHERVNINIGELTPNYLCLYHNRQGKDPRGGIKMEQLFEDVHGKKTPPTNTTKRNWPEWLAIAESHIIINKNH